MNDGLEAESSEVGKHIRASLVLSGMTSSQVATELNISGRTLDRMVTGERRARDWELRRISELTNVPLWFLEGGPDGAPIGGEEADAGHELEGLVARLRALEGVVDGQGRSMTTALEALTRAIEQLHDQRDAGDPPAKAESSAR